MDISYCGLWAAAQGVSVALSGGKRCIQRFLPVCLSHADLPIWAQTDIRGDMLFPCKQAYKTPLQMSLRRHTFTDTHTLADNVLSVCVCVCAHERFAEVGIYIMLCSMIKNNCSAAVCTQWCKVTWYCPTALFCMSWTGPYRESPNTHTRKYSYPTSMHTDTHTATNKNSYVYWLNPK